MFEAEPKREFIFWVERAMSACRSILFGLNVSVGLGVLAVDKFRGVAARHSQENNTCLHGRDHDQALAGWPA